MYVIDTLNFQNLWKEGNTFRSSALSSLAPEKRRLIHSILLIIWWFADSFLYRTALISVWL